MHISNLHLFSINRDSVESHRGYTHQNLKALEAWVKNKVENVGEDVYCDYEEDIFQMNFEDYKAKFRQIKLYTEKTFSFQSIEIKKAVAHFFTLFVKGEYLFDKPTFLFEVNTDIAKKYGGNDADLLEEWQKSEGRLEGDLLKRCIERAKAIVKEYFEKRIAEENGSDLGNTLHGMLPTFETLDEAFWASFVNAIQWKFTTTAPEVEVANVINSINDYISLLQYPVSSEQIFSALYSEVGLRSIDKNPENRCLSKSLIDSILLNLGDEKDKRYADLYAKWQDAEITEFNVGEFYEVLKAARYCRNEKYLADHSDHWIKLLLEYINFSETPKWIKREAIYEFVWVLVRPTLDIEKFQITDANGAIALVREFFEDLEQYDSTSEMADGVSLLAILYGMLVQGMIDVSHEEFASWVDRYTKFFEREIASTNNTHRLCHLHEAFGFLKLSKPTWKTPGATRQQAIDEFEKIIPLLDRTPKYPVFNLSQKLEPLVSLLRGLNNDKDSKLIETFLDRIAPFVEARATNFNRAKKFTVRGADAIESGKANPRAPLIAIHNFHLAKQLYHEDQAIEGYVLALLNLSQFYSGVGLHFAAKYYALVAIKTCFDQNDSTLYRKISGGYLFVFWADFRSGSWMNAVYSFYIYLTSRSEFETTSIELADNSFRQAIYNIISIIVLSDKLFPQMTYFIAAQRKQISEIHDEGIKAAETVYGKMSLEKATEVASKMASDQIYNDIGSTRSVAWIALGISWRVTFNNDYTGNFVGEEFCAVLQIALAELAFNFGQLPYRDGCEVNVKIEHATSFIPPELEQRGNTINVRLFSMALAKPKTEEINFHYAALSTSISFIMEQLVVMAEDDWRNVWSELHEKHSLGGKGLMLAGYQCLYQELITEESHALSQRIVFVPVPNERKLQENPALRKTPPQT